MLLPLLGNLYVVWRTFRVIPFPLWGKWLVVVVMLSVFFGMFAAMGRGLDKLSMGLATAIYELTTSWLIVLLYLFIAFVVLDVLRLCHVVPVSFLRDSWAGTLTVAGVVTALLVYGNIHYRNKVRQPLQLTTSKTLNRPLKIIMLSDLHLGYHNRRDELHRWVEMLNGEKADLILIAGDIIDRSVRPLLDDSMDLEMLRLNAPVVACLGNHEYYAGEPNSLEFYKRADITLLRDTVLQWGPLQIVGRDDRTNLRRKPLKELCRGLDKSKYTILLDLSPTIWRRPRSRASTSSLAGTPITGRYGPSAGSRRPSMNVLSALGNAATRTITSAQASASGVASSASALALNTS